MPTLLSMGFFSRLTETATSSPKDSSATTQTHPSPAPAPAAAPVVPKKRSYNAKEKDPTQAVDNHAHKANKRPRLGAQILSSRPKLFAKNGLLSLAGAASSATSSSTSLFPPAAAPPPTGPRGDQGESTCPTDDDEIFNADVGNTASAGFSNARNGRLSGLFSTSAGPPTGSNSGASTPIEALRRGWNEVRATPDTAGTRAALGNSVEDKRSLRSHDGGSRSRSELAQYFPNWDEIVSNEPQPQEPLTAKTRLHITEEAPKQPSTPSRGRQVILPPTSPTQQTPSRLGTGEARVLSPSTSRGSSFSTFTKVDFSEQLATIPRNITKDPLSEEHFRLAHQRGERQEKQLKNIEKEKAQHEKVQLERLYEGLLGHDWLRVMGISGITDTEKKAWEEKRDWVLREVKGLLDKFERYREEEKRLRLEREALMQDDDESDEDDEEDNEASEQEVADTEDEEDIEVTEQEHRKRRRRTKNSPASKVRREHQPGIYTDTLAASQLQREVPAPTVRPGPGRSRKLTGIDVTPLIPPLPPAEEKPFVSFFEKPHLRAAALSGNRRGRSRFAFGHAIAELEEEDFSLPRDMVTAEARKASARMRRLRRRSVKD